MACKSFKQSSTKLCEAIATMTRTLCTTYIDSATIEPLVARRLIPLDKGEGAVRPIGVGEVIRRIIGKCVMNVSKGDVVEASGSLHLWAGQRPAARLLYMLFMPYLKQMTRTWYCSSMLLMHSMHLTEQLHCITSGFSAL